MHLLFSVIGFTVLLQSTIPFEPSMCQLEKEASLSLYRALDNLKYNDNICELATGYDTIFVSAFDDLADEAKELYDLSPTAVQLAYRKAIKESTDSAGKVVKSEDEITEAGQKAIAEKDVFYSKYLEQLDGFTENKINHIINGSKGSNHGWEKLVPDKNWDDIKKIIVEVMDTGVEGSYKTVYSKKKYLVGMK